jgi:hypothetical protein
MRTRSGNDFARILRMTCAMDLHGHLAHVEFGRDPLVRAAGNDERHDLTLRQFAERIHAPRLRRDSARGRPSPRSRRVFIGRQGEPVHRAVCRFVQDATIGGE